MGVVLVCELKFRGRSPETNTADSKADRNSTRVSRHRQKGVVKSMILRLRRCRAKTAVNTRDSQELGGECDEF